MRSDMTVFYLDDDLEDQEFFKGIADDIAQDIHVVTHNYGDDLIDALQNPPPTPNVVFLDLNMPGKNGFQVLEEVRKDERTTNVPVVIFSTSKDEESIAKTWKLGANLYLPKCTSFEGFKKSLEFALSIDWNNHEPSLNNFLYQA